MSVKTMARFSARSAGPRPSTSEGAGEGTTGGGPAASREDVMIVVGARPRNTEGSSRARLTGPVVTRDTGDDPGVDDGVDDFGTDAQGLRHPGSRSGEEDAPSLLLSTVCVDAATTARTGSTPQV